MPLPQSYRDRQAQTTRKKTTTTTPFNPLAVFFPDTGAASRGPQQPGQNRAQVFADNQSKKPETRKVKSPVSGPTATTATPQNAGWAFAAPVPARGVTPATAEAVFAPQGWATSYNDPSYAQAERVAAQRLGLGPEYIDVVGRLRTLGERTNNGQVSPAGARTPYQFIPQTRQAFINKYKIDPWADPVSGAMGAMLHIKESVDRGNTMEQAVGEYIGGPDRNNWGPTTKAYIDRVMGIGSANTTGAPPTFQSPFDPGYWNAAQGEINAAQQAAMTPFSLDIKQAPRPEFPDAPEMPKMDWTKTDEALQALKPQLTIERDRARIVRSNLFSGLAQGLASLPDGAGLGKVLGNLGAGLAQGRANADAEIQSRIDAFDEKMAAWNMLNYQHEGQKATQIYNEAAAEAGQMFQYNMSKWANAMDVWNNENAMQVTEGGIISRSKTDGGVRVTVTPNAPAVAAAYGMHRASLYGNMANAQQQGAGMVASATNSFVTNVAMTEWEKSQQTDPSLLLNSGGFLAQQVYSSGMARQIFGDELMNDLYASVDEKLEADGLYDSTSDQYIAARDQYMIAEIMTGMTMHKEYRDAVMNAAPMLQEMFMTKLQTERLGR